MEQLVVLVQVYDLEGNPVTLQFCNPSLGVMEMCMEHTKRVCGKSSEILEFKRTR
jgi:hypothetical protein